MEFFDKFYKLSSKSRFFEVTKTLLKTNCIMKNTQKRYAIVYVMLKRYVVLRFPSSQVFHSDSLETNEIQSASLQSLPEV